MNASKPNKKFPWYGFPGLLIMVISWYFNWTTPGLRTQIWFFPLWIGYILFIDACVFYRKKTSLIKRSIKKFFSLFFLSMIVWWFFELLNARTANWHYLGREYFSDFEFFLLSTLAFSTVIPAVFGTSELIGSYRWVREIATGPRIPATSASLIGFLGFGIITFLLLIIWPGYFYPFIWISPYFILDALNYRLGKRSLVYFSNIRDWRPMIALATGCLICGFFWEMWNYYSFPKWVYNTPGVDFLHIFEMPLPGYLGYIPFSFELFSFYQMATGSRQGITEKYYIRILED